MKHFSAFYGCPKPTASRYLFHSNSFLTHDSWHTNWSSPFLLYPPFLYPFPSKSFYKRRPHNFRRFWPPQCLHSYLIYSKKLTQPLSTFPRSTPTLHCGRHMWEPPSKEWRESCATLERRTKELLISLISLSPIFPLPSTGRILSSISWRRAAAIFKSAVHRACWGVKTTRRGRQINSCESRSWFVELGC